jgi:hypothetical protein
MTKPISTRVHGIIDYAWAGTATSMARRLDRAGAAARLLHGAASAATASALVTNFEYGALRLLPMKGHLAVDTLLCSLLVASPLFLPSAERRHAIVPVLLGIAGLVTGMLTETQSPTESREEFGGMYGGGERWVADPDLRESPHLRRHLE